MRLDVRALLVLALLFAAGPAAAGPGPGCDAAALAAAHARVLEVCPCETATTHGRFVSCAVRLVNSMLREGTLARECRWFLRRGITRSTCGKPGFVACCRVNATSGPLCSVKRPDTCLRIEGCTGTTSSCLDACATLCAGSASGAFLD